MPLCRYVLNAFPAPFRFFLTLQSPQLCKELAHHPFRLEAQACIGVPNACGVSVCVVVSPRYVLASHGHAQITWPKVCSRVRHALVPRIMHGHASACGVHDGVPKALPCTNHCTVYFLHPSETVGTMYTLYLGLHYSRTSWECRVRDDYFFTFSSLWGSQPPVSCTPQVLGKSKLPLHFVANYPPPKLRIPPRGQQITPLRCCIYPPSLLQNTPRIGDPPPLKGANPPPPQHVDNSPPPPKLLPIAPLSQIANHPPPQPFTFTPHKEYNYPLKSVQPPPKILL